MHIIRNPRFLCFLALASALLILSPGAAIAQDFTVVCGDPDAPADFHRLNDAVWATLNLPGAHTITVSGTCRERVAIGDGTFSPSNLYIVAAPGQNAVITPPSGGQGKGWVMMICGAHEIALERLTITGGSIGITVCDASHFDSGDLIIENNTSAGVQVDWNSTVFLGGGTVIRNNGWYGVIADRSNVALYGAVTPDGTVHTVTVEGHSRYGVYAEGSVFSVVGPVVIQNNGTAGSPSAGIALTRGSSLHSSPMGNLGSEITANNAPGIVVDLSSTASLNYANIHNNTGLGVQIQRLSSAELGPQVTLSGNGGFAVTCDSSSWLFGNVAGVAPLDCKNTEAKVK